MASYPGAGECARATLGASPSPACRAFLADRPWSAAFVSWVLVQARLPGFRPSTGHLDYVRDAWQRDDNAYALADPDREAPAAGDLLCFVRGNGGRLGYDGLKAFLKAGLVTEAELASVPLALKRWALWPYRLGYVWTIAAVVWAVWRSWCDIPID